MKAPGKGFRQGMSLVEAASMFDTDRAARDWIESRRWPDGPRCPRCGTGNVQSNIKHRSMTHRCRECAGKPMFSVRTGTVMEASNLPFRIWAVGIYIFVTNIKGVSSMKLHRDLGIGQKAAWFLLQRLRAGFESDDWEFDGPVEVDEMYLGGKERNKHERKKLHAGRGAVVKTAVVGMRDRATGKVVAKVVSKTDGKTLKGFVTDRARKSAIVFSDEAAAYKGLDRMHFAVNHGVGEFAKFVEHIKGKAHTNGIESHWAMMGRGYYGTYHKISPKHLGRYVAEFVGRHNDRNLDTIGQMGRIVKGMEGKRLKCSDLIAENGLPSGARPAPPPWKKMSLAEYLDDEIPY